jgi:hypothetical protein
MIDQVRCHRIRAQAVHRGCLSVRWKSRGISTRT